MSFLGNRIYSIAVIVVVLSLNGCGGPEVDQVESGTRDQILHLGNGTEPQGLDPHIVTGVPEHHIITALFEGLVLKNPYTLEVEPGVAERWEISGDGRTYTFYLREGAVWSNGDPVTAEDFRWSWMRALKPELGSLYNYMYFPIVNAEAFANGEIDSFDQVGVKVLDGRTLQVQLYEPTPYLLQLFDHYSTFPVHRANIEAFGSISDRLSRWAREGNMVSNGAFELTEWKINSHVRVEKRDSYWDAENVKLNGIVFYPTENITTEERMFRDHMLHKTNDVPLDKIPLYRAEQPELIELAPYLGTYFYAFNITRPPFDDVRVRRALGMTIDRELLVDTVLQGINTAAHGITPPDTMGYNPPKLFDFDPELARQLLAEAGYPDGEGFPPFEVLYNTSEAHQKIAVAIQQMWQQHLNIKVTLTNQEWKVYLDTLNNMDFDVSRRAWIADYIDPNGFLDMFLTGGGNNRTGFSNETYDRIIQQDAPKAIDQKERYKLFAEAETILINSMPVIPIYTYSIKHLKRESVKGMPTNLMDYYNYKYVYLEAEE